MMGLEEFGLVIIFYAFLSISLFHHSNIPLTNEG